MIARWAAQYVGIPFQEDGLTRAGCHCWGLVRLVLAEQAGVAAPSYGTHSAADLIAASRNFQNGTGGDLWPAAERPYRAFDGVLMTAMADMNGARARRIPAHCGIMVSPLHVLHVWAETNAVIMPLDHPRIRTKIVGVFRHRDLA